MIALACIYIASVLKDKDITLWFEELRVDMNIVSVPVDHLILPWLPSFDSLAIFIH